jgi:HEAT repeat protein
VHVILTTRLDPQCLPGIECEPIGGLPEEDALRLLERYRPFANEEEKAAAREIVRRLDGYVLELEVVAVYLWQTPDVSYTAYLERFRQEGLMAVEGAAQQDTVMLSRHSQKSVSKLLQPILDGLSRLEWFALGLAALFHPDSIPLPWVRELLEAKGVLGGSLPGYPDPWRQLERRLLGLRLLTDTSDPNLARMHPVIQEVVAATYPEFAAENLRPVAKHAAERAQAIKFTFDPPISQPVAAFWEWQAIQGFASWLLEKQEADVGCTLAYFAAAILPWRADENERLLRRAIGLAQQALADNADRDQFLAVCYLALADVLIVGDRYQEARDVLSPAAALSRIDPGLSKKLVLMRDYVGQAEAQYHVALAKMRTEYWERLASVAAGHPDTRSLDEWLTEHDRSWIRWSEPVAGGAAVAGTSTASRAEERREREIARIEHFLATDSEYLSAELVAEFRRLVECGAPSGEIRDEIVPIVLPQRYERERQKPDAVMPFTLEEMYEHLRYGIMGLTNGRIQAHSGRPSFKGPLEHWLAQVVGERTEAFLEEALRLRFLVHDETYQVPLVIRDHMAFGHFLAKLRDRETKYRSHAALILGDVGDPRAVDTMVAVLEDERDDALVRAHVAMALGAIQDERAVLPLMLLLDDEHEVTLDGVYLKAFVKAGIRRMGAIALDVLFSALADPRPLMRAYAIEALVQLADPRATSRLQALHNDGGVIPPNRLGVQGGTVAERSYNAIGLINAFAKAQRG